MEDDAGNGVHHGGERGDWENVSGDFDGALFSGTLNFLDALGMGHGADVPNVAENVARVGDENGRKFAVILPSAGDGLFVDGAAGGVEKERFGGDVRLRAVEAYVALALLLGIVEGMRVEEGPDELTGNVFQAEFKMGVLVDGVMTAVEGGGADVEALLVSDFFGADQAGSVAGAGGGDGGVKGMGPGVAEGDARRSSFDEFAREGIFEHSGLGGHCEKEFNTESAGDTEGRKIATRKEGTGERTFVRSKFAPQ